MIYFILISHSILSWSYALDDSLHLTPSQPNVAVGIGEKVSIECSILSVNKNIYPRWKVELGGNKFVHRQENTMPDGKVVLVSRLEFTHFAERDVGSYVCEFGDPPKKSAHISLIGLDVVKTVATFQYEMEKAELVCKVTPTNRTVSVAFEGWYYYAGSSEPLSGEKYSISAGRLGITNPMRNYSGTYSARYILKFGSNEISYDCRVDFKAAPLILNLPRSQNIMLGQDINITCTVISYPKSIVHWTVDDKELPLADHRFKLSDLNGHKHSKLSLTSARYADKGKYNCTAVNGLGNSSTKSILLRVKDPFEWIYPLIGLVSQSMVVSVIIIICARREKRLLEDINPKKK